VVKKFFQTPSYIHTYTYSFTDPSSTQVRLNVEFVMKRSKLYMQSSQISYKLHKISKNMINCREKIIHTIIIIIIRVKYECSCVYIVMTSRQKFLNGIKGIFNKLVS
jgi:hypothetical protein